MLTQHNTITLNDVGVDTFNLSGSPTVTAYNLVRASTFDGIALFPATQSQVSHNRTGENNGPGIGLYDSAQNALHNNVVNENADGGIVLDDADENLVAHNEVMRNGTGTADTTDGIRANTLSTGNTIRNNQLRNNVTHDCHDDSVGLGTSLTANVWLDNHGGTENRPGLCTGDDAAMSLEATTAFGWDPDYPWYDFFGAAAGYDWVTAYGAIDTDSLLQALPEIPLGNRGRVAVSPHP